MLIDEKIFKKSKHLTAYLLTDFAFKFVDKIYQI